MQLAGESDAPSPLFDCQDFGPGSRNRSVYFDNPIDYRVAPEENGESRFSEGLWREIGSDDSSSFI